MPAKPAPKKNASAIKRARQTVALTLKNKSLKKMLSTLSKKVEKEVANKSVESAEAAFRTAVSAIDKAAGKGVIHKNTAARRISRLKRLVNSVLPSAAA